MAALSGEVGVPDQDVLEQELEELLRYAISLHAASAPGLPCGAATVASAALLTLLAPTHNPTFRSNALPGLMRP